MEGAPDNIIEFPGPRTEMINGVATNLGRISLEQLHGLLESIEDRIDDAKVDQQIVQDEIGRRMADGV
jgi:hypothetical protein